MSFPNGNPDCLVCGTCKRQRVLAHQAAGRIVVFIGDGESDRYAAAYSDVIFAKRDLIALCRSEGWAFQPWHDFRRVGGLARRDRRRMARGSGEPARPAPALHLRPGGRGPGRTNPPEAARRAPRAPLA